MNDTKYQSHYFGKTVILGFYREQLAKFRRIGLGGQTEHGTIVTNKLIDITKKRMNYFISEVIAMRKRAKRRLDDANVHKRKHLESVCGDHSD